MADICNGLRSLGFASAGVKMSEQSLDLLPKQPTILFVFGSHFVTVLPLGDGNVVVLDPPYRPKLKTLRELSEGWNGEAIVTSRHEADLRANLARLGILRQHSN
jgi:ABC-type bacteriocin/lantibiotic exporter with double-glycine peptidase domain